MFSFSDSHCSEFNEMLPSYNCNNDSLSTQELSEDNIEEQYEIFMRESWENRPFLLSKLEKLNEIFKAKYPDFPGLKFDDLMADRNDD